MPSCYSIETTVKKKLLTFWELKLHDDSDALRSLLFFQSRFMYLTKPHPLWSSCRSSPYRVSMATVQAQMLTSRYRVGALTRHWIKDYKGNCRLSTECLDSLEDLPHLLKWCPALHNTRHELLDYTRKYVVKLPTKTSSGD